MTDVIVWVSVVTAQCSVVTRVVVGGKFVIVCDLLIMLWIMVIVTVTHNTDIDTGNMVAMAELALIAVDELHIDILRYDHTGLRLI